MLVSGLGPHRVVGEFVAIQVELRPMKSTTAGGTNSTLGSRFSSTRPWVIRLANSAKTFGVSRSGSDPTDAGHGQSRMRGDEESSHMHIVRLDVVFSVYALCRTADSSDRRDVRPAGRGSGAGTADRTQFERVRRRTWKSRRKPRPPKATTKRPAPC